MNMTSLEIEVKFHLNDPDGAREQLRAIGARFSGRSMETNIRFEDRDHTLIRKKSLLRLRKTDRQNTLTFKGEPPEADKRFKIHRELEVTVNDFDIMYTILQAIGFQPAQRYEKIRETYEVEGAQLCLDRMPFGDFLEIEGEPDIILETARRMELDWHERILTSYLAIFDRLKDELRLRFDDVTFENFRNVDIDFRRYVHLFTDSQ